ncbi:MAG: EAL domain-containing protein [Methylococcaceae bacterium]|nr:EAL domain-containing protein [Methylococcaceae bacterium]
MAKEQLFNAELLLKIINSLPSPIFVKNTKHQLIFINDAFCKFMGRGYKDLIGKSDYDLSLKEEADVFLEMDDRVFKSRQANINEENHTDFFGNTRIIQTKKMILEGCELGDFLCGVITDITELKHLNKKLRKQAYRDCITGLMNRVAFDEAATKYLNNFHTRDQKFALLYLDMDGLKFVNDSYGHAAGDKLIQETGKIISTVLEQKGEVARIGGDEFMLLMPYREKNDVVTIVEKVLAALKKPTELDKRKIIFSASIGIACCPDDSTNINALVQYADSSMYETKRHRKGSYTFYKKEYTSYQKQFFLSAKRKLELENELRKAMKNKQLTVHFQPIFKNDQIVGYESLSRWVSPEFGTISPAEFIPIAEESDLILMLGVQTLQAAVEFINKKCVNGEYVSVNVSPIQLKHHAFKSSLESIVKQSNIQSPKQLVIEVTERLMMDMNEHLESIVNSPCLKDIKYFIDDFGTGYSNLAQLKKLNFDTLKIDREYIKDLPSSSSDISLIKTMIFMANEFDMKVIAEGIETEEQKQCLAELGCDYFQGNLLGKPASHEYWG